MLTTSNKQSKYLICICKGFKSSFTMLQDLFKPDKDVGAHWLRTNDWIDTHAFPKGVKVQQLCLTLVGEARLWYEALRPIALDGMGYKINLDSNALREAIIGNNYSLHRDPSTSMKMQKY